VHIRIINKKIKEGIDDAGDIGVPKPVISDT
jgi:hypothetical protein